MSFAPYCVRCKGRHFFHEDCLPESKPFSQRKAVCFEDRGTNTTVGCHSCGAEVVTSACGECVLLQKRVAELEARLDRYKAVRDRRNAYQKKYMRKRRDTAIALKLNTL